MVDGDGCARNRNCLERQTCTFDSSVRPQENGRNRRARPTSDRISNESTWPNTLRSTNSEGKVSTKLQLRIPRSLRVLKTANDDAKFNDRQLASLSTYSFDLFSREWVTVSVCLVLWNNEWLHYNSIRQCLGVLIVKFPMNLVVWPWK